LGFGGEVEGGLQLVVGGVERLLGLWHIHLTLNQKVGYLVIIELQERDEEVYGRILPLLGIKIVDDSRDKPEILGFDRFHEAFAFLLQVPHLR